MTLLATFGLPPAEAIAYFRQKGMHLAWDWRWPCILAYLI
jgi:hypothetical protein